MRALVTLAHRYTEPPFSVLFNPSNRSAACHARAAAGSRRVQRAAAWCARYRRRYPQHGQQATRRVSRAEAATAALCGTWQCRSSKPNSPSQCIRTSWTSASGAFGFTFRMFRASASIIPPLTVACFVAALTLPPSAHSKRGTQEPTAAKVQTAGAHSEALACRPPRRPVRARLCP